MSEIVNNNNGWTRWVNRAKSILDRIAALEEAVAEGGGSSSGQIPADLQTTLDALTAKDEVHDSRLNGIGTSVSGLSERVATVENGLSTAQTDIQSETTRATQAEQALREAVEALQGWKQTMGDDSLDEKISQINAAITDLEQGGYVEKIQRIETGLNKEVQTDRNAAIQAAITTAKNEMEGIYVKASDMSDYATKQSVSESVATEESRAMQVEQALQEAIDNLPTTGGTPPDEEDITRAQEGDGDVLKFKDKEYAPESFSGLGRVYLRKNIVGGKNILTQAMVNRENTVYHIQYDYTLDGATINIPTGCTLEFDGGSIGGGTLKGNNTIVSGPNAKFKNDLTISGTWNNETIYSRWFEFISSEDGTTDNVVVFKQLQNMANGTRGCKIEFDGGYYQSSVVLNTPTKNETKNGVSYPYWPMNEYSKDGEIVLHIIDIPYVDINLNNSTIKLINAQNPGAMIIQVDNVANSYIHDGIIIGNAFDFDYPQYVNYNKDLKNDYEWQGGVYNHGGFFTCYNLNVHHFNGDGINVGSGGWFKNTFNKYPSKGYVIRDCEVSYCGRNGVTLHSSHEGYLKNVHIHHIGSDASDGKIGSDGIMGRSPQAGIDVEFEDKQYLVPIMNWESLYIHDCREKVFGFADQVFSKMRSFICKNSIFIGLPLLNHINSETDNNVFENCYFEKGSSSVNGNMRGSNVTFMNCSIIIKDGKLFTAPKQTYVDCTISDDRTENLTYDLYGQVDQVGSTYTNCRFNLKGEIGYLGINAKFKGCTFDVPVVRSWNVADTEFDDCIFNDKTDDANGYTFRFRNLNFAVTTGLVLKNCIFDKGRGLGTSMDAFFLPPIATLDNCIFKESLSFICYDGSKYQFTNVVSPYIYTRGYQPTGGTTPYQLTLDNCRINKIWLQQNNYERYDNSFVVKNSHISADKEFNNVNLENSSFNSGELTSVAKIKAKGSTITLPSVTSSSTQGYVLENCYVSGITEANYQGTKTNCKFQVSFPTSGTFAGKPSAAPVGYKYFCTDKQTTEGATNGIEIIHKGGNVWVDALGRVVS